MFKKLTEFGYKRTAVEALGFYLAYMVLILLVAFLIGAIMGVALSAEIANDYAGTAGVYLMIIAPIILMILVMYEKGLLKDFRYILLTVLIGILTSFLAGFFDLLALIPVAVLTTLKPAVRKTAKKTKKTKKSSKTGKARKK